MSAAGWPLKVLGLQARLLADPRQHSRADLLAVVESKAGVVRCEPHWGLMDQPIRSNADSTRLARVEGH